MHLNLQILPQGLSRKFEKVYKRNLSNGSVSRPGDGSDLSQTQLIQKELIQTLRRFDIQTILDVPCGDCYWISQIDLEDIQYTGADIAKSLVKDLSNSNKNMQRTFIILDITKKPPKSYDAILCRDLLVHLNTRQIKKVIKNVKKSGYKYLITTQFTNSRDYKNLPIVSKAIA